jgi:DNA (cytosine-5)-methyltransferase 1
MSARNAVTNGRNEYLDLLDEAWQAHLTPREPDAPTFISLFAGCGGASLGYSMAGYRELLAVEWDDNAVETFKLNFPDVSVYHGDIHDLTVERCLEITGLRPGELDLLDGSPPCQGFSTAGKRQMGDLRNQLYHEYVRLLRGLQPKVFVMENVSGLVKGKMKLIFADIMRELKASGYQVRCKLLNAMYFNVPQSRERLIWIGVRKEENIKLSFPDSLNTVSVKACFSQGGDILSGIELVRWQHIPPGGNWLNLPRTLINGRARYSNFHRRLHPERPSYTVGKEEHYSSGRFYHWSEPRRINDIELIRIGSFPDKFRWISDGRILHRYIGNSVPPLFMRAIAQHIRDTIVTKGNG